MSLSLAVSCQGDVGMEDDVTTMVAALGQTYDRPQSLEDDADTDPYYSPLPDHPSSRSVAAIQQRANTEPGGYQRT